MLTSGDWTPERNFFVAFFNPSFLPQTVLRTGGSIGRRRPGHCLSRFVSLRQIGFDERGRVRNVLTFPSCSGL